MTNGLDRFNMVLKFEFFVAPQVPRFEVFVLLQESQHLVFGCYCTAIRHGLEEFVIGRFRVGVAVVSLVWGRCRVTRNDPGPPRTVVAGKR